MKSQHTSLKHLLALTFMVHFRDVVQLTNRGLSKSGMFPGSLFFQDHRVTPFLGKMGGLFNVQRARGDVGPKKCGSSGEESTNKTRFFFGVCEFGKMMCHKRATCVCEWAPFLLPFVFVVGACNTVRPKKQNNSTYWCKTLFLLIQNPKQPISRVTAICALAFALFTLSWL